MVSGMPKASVLVANNVAMEIGTNNVVIMGAFDGLQAPVFPARTSFYAIAKVWGMPASEDSGCKIRLIDPVSDQVVAEAGEHKFVSVGPAQVHTAISHFQNISLPKSGSYEVRAYVGENVIGSYPVSVASLAKS